MRINMKIGARIYRHKHKVQDIVIENNDPTMTRTKKIFAALEEICREFDLQVPIWLDVNIRDFKCFSKTRFTKDSFIEEIDFDYLEIVVYEED